MNRINDGIELPIGTRGSVKRFSDVYQPAFLKEHGLDLTARMISLPHQTAEISNETIVTYIGHGYWGIFNG